MMMPPTGPGPTLRRLQALRSGKETSQLLPLLQLVHDGVQEVVMVQPLDPFRYMASYLQHNMSLDAELEEVALTKELHRKQIALGKLRLELAHLRHVRVHALRDCLVCEQDLRVGEMETVVTADDHAFLQPEPQKSQVDWTPPTIPSHFDDDATTTIHILDNNRSALEYFLPECIDAIVQLGNVKPPDPLRWLVQHFYAKSSAAEYELAALKATVGSYRWYIDQVRGEVPIAEANACAASAKQQSLRAQLSERNRLILHLSVTHLGPRTDRHMKGKQVLVNREKLWISPEHIEPIDQFTPFQLHALHRAEAFLMEADEVALKTKLQFDLEYQSSTKIQATYKCHVLYRMHQQVMATRHAAAARIQRVYERYLYAKAIQLPPWCVLGQQVLVAMSIARRAAIWFQFYAGKDFAAGNFTTLPPPHSIDILEKRCRQDDKCAAFASDGSLKRFVPRQLSQLHALKATDGREIDMAVDGLYVKRIPQNDDEVTTHAIVTSLPTDKFGPVRVVFDGTGVPEDIPVQKLSVRWKRTYDFETDTWHFVDGVTQAKAATAPEPYADDESRRREIDARKRSYALERDANYIAKKLQSAITLQCAYRNRKARQLFRYMLALREKEKEHAAKVEQVAEEVAKKKKKRRWWFERR
ncbi:hypothetical protein H310_12322 [Aphanomyces invadans]|uniref:Uncharacterized protein n=1 Tax=Aphanomyces invadans TaxID=157072 RepID=A0A024TJG9_9STRA|nr:hypothetical protein H310_12322 [Aphanomyces invadans]ETV93756.1 hypothetical protein H310_12322 [Aphanomyces invadans]|eukprot:XP_008877565.1 hypothetical protein H310_12322 [Aphanomyces invadans]